MVWFRTCLYPWCVTLPVASTQQLAAVQLTAVPTRATAQGKPPAAPSTISQGPTAGDVGKTNVVPSTGQATRNTSSAFNQMVAEIVAESAGPDTPPPAAPAYTVKLLPKSAAPSADQLPDLPAPAGAALTTPTGPAILPAMPVVGRRQDTRGAATRMNGNAVQPPAVPVDVNVLIPIAPKLQEPSFSDRGLAGPKPGSTAPVSNTEDPVAITLQPKPILEVSIHLNQPAPETLFVRNEIIPAAQSVKEDIAKPIAVNAVVPATSAAMASVPAVVAVPVVPTPPNVAPVAVPPVPAAPVVPARVVAPAVAAAPVVTVPLAAPAVFAAPIASTPVAAAPVAASVAPVDAPLTTHGAQGEALKQQNPEQGSPDPGDAGHAASRTTGIQEAPVIVQQTKPDAGGPQLPGHIATAAPAGAVPQGAAPVPPIAAPAPMTATDAKPEPPAGSAPLRQESLADQTRTQQPIRSLALEFTPDGAGDIKVRLSERAGDVHISLHGTDPSLAGRVREGVSDLVGSLSKAGYDAEAWTPGQGRQNPRQESEQRKPPRPTSGGADAEEFSGILQQPLQEIS